MPQQQENLEQQEEQEELDLAEQLDALLVQLQELEPDLFSETDAAEPMPAVESPPQTDTSPETADAVQESDTSELAPPLSVEASSTDLPSDADSSDALPSSPASDPLAQDVAEPSADPTEESVDEQSEKAMGEALDSILAEAVASEMNDVESEDEVQPGVIEDASDTEAADAGGDVDLVDQLQALLNTEDVADAPPQSDPPAQEVQAEQIVDEPADDAIPAADADPLVDELSMEQIDQLLAEEAIDSPEADGLEGLVEAPVEVAGQAQPASSSAAVEEADSPVERVNEVATHVTSNTTEGGGGFDADAEAVARELDDQPELNARPTVSVAPEADEPSRTSRARFRFDKQRLVACATACERLLRRLCTAINSPVRQLHPSIRDAIGVAAVFHLLVGSVLILGKLVGAI